MRATALLTTARFPTRSRTMARSPWSRSARSRLRGSRVTLTVGVLGGMGPEASADFYRRITEHTLASRDQDHLHVLVDSDPSIPDRTAYLQGRGPDPPPALVSMARRLAAARAEILVMACNTAHTFYAEVAASVDVPLVDWVGEAARLVAGGRVPGTAIGLLATSGTIGAGLYQHAFEALGLGVLGAGAEA